MEPDASSARRNLTLLRAVLVAHLAIVSILAWKLRPWMTADSDHYLALARALLGTRSFGIDEPEAFRSPGYPVFLAVCGGSPLAVVVVQTVLYLAALCLGYAWTATVFGNRATRLFLIVSLLYPFVAFSVPSVMPEIVSLFFVTLTVWLLLRYDPGTAALAGVSIAAAGYVRPNLWVLGLALTIGLFLQKRRRQAIALLATALLLAAPWAARNGVLFGSPTPIPPYGGTGILLYLGTWEARLSTSDMLTMARGVPLSSEAGREMQDQVRRLNASLGVTSSITGTSIEDYTPNATKSAADRLFRQAAWENIRAHPWENAVAMAARVLRMWFSGWAPPGVPRLARWALLAMGPLIVALGIFGVCRTLCRPDDPRRRDACLAALLVLLTFTATLMWGHIEARYTIPGRILLLAFAAAGLQSVLRSFPAFDLSRNSST